jgi:prepilin-type N-terminal cleavage/methylation domain-containing protein
MSMVGRKLASSPSSLRPERRRKDRVMRTKLPALQLQRRIGKRQSGFSLIELLIVIAVLLIIAAIAIPNFIRSKMRACEQSRQPTSSI